MDIQEIKIEMAEEDLVDFRKFLLEQGGSEFEPQEIHEVSPGFQREPIIIALVVALGGPVLIKEFVSLTKEWLQLRQEERLMRFEMKLNLLSAGGRKPVSLSDLENIS